MQLLEILDEISIGFNNNDEKSKKLKSKVNEVKQVLESTGSVLENRSLEFRVDLNNSIDSKTYPNSQIFFQGSYAISTAIKHRNYDVDADLAFFIKETLAEDARLKVYHTLENAFPKYDVTLKKPCIEIDFKDGYKIDVAIYSDNNDYEDTVFFHNAISGSERVVPAKPKQIVTSFKEYLSNNQIKRNVIRLMKHFMKNIQKELKIDEVNKLPSIALMLISTQQFHPLESSANEETLENNLKKLCDITINTLLSGEKISSTELLINDTLYKVKDIKETLKIIQTVKNNLSVKNYASMVSGNVFESLMKKKEIDMSPSLKGTMG